MKKNIFKVTGTIVLLILIWGSYAAIRAHSNLVSLDVHNADVREVIRKVEWQTWESIFVQKEVEGKITLKVHKIPLEEVLNLISEQSSSRWTAMYPLYSTGKSLVAFKQSMRGDIDPAANGWTNFSNRASFGGFGGFGSGGFGDNARSQNSLVSMQVVNQDLSATTHALGRYAQARVIAEDGASGTVTLSLNQATMPQAVKQLSHQVHRKWTQYYLLQSWRGGPRRGGGGDLAGRDGRDGTNDVPREPTPEELAERQKRFEAQLATMTPEERAKAEEDRKRREAFRNMSPEDRQKAFQSMADNPEFKSRIENRMMNSIKNTTPEQRVERAQRFSQRRNRPANP
jgi:type II secretory pathway component GspD/PulD (secretin)